MPSIEGVSELRAVGVQLRAAPARMRARMRRRMVTATAPITSEAKAGYGSGPLGSELGGATRLRVATTGKGVGVSVGVYGARMGDGKESLPPLVEGLRPWRHPRWGKPPWYSQAARPELGPAVQRHLPGVELAVVEAVSETADELAAG